MNAIDIQHLTMKFNLPNERISSLKEFVIKSVKGQIRYNEFTALKDISLCVEHGESVAIVGSNGSGKSTLLKVISGIYAPTEGTVRVNGNIYPMIELGTGFDPELTARENVFLNGAILGHKQSMLREIFDDIISFAELWDFVDVAIKNYSSGMVARLAFSIATIGKPDILICDEILGVGDFKFQQKCSQRIADLLSGGTTFLLVSHNVGQVVGMCKKAVYLEKGNMLMFGDAKEVCDYYVQRASG